MAEIVNVKDAASRLAQFADEAVSFFQQLNSSNKDIIKRLEQWESLSRLANEVESVPSTDSNDTEKQLEFTTQILLHCSEITKDILTGFDWREFTLDDPGLVTVYDRLNGKRVKTLFEDLEREQLCLVAFRESECVINKSINEPS